jgi:hypothetical protein
MPGRLVGWTGDVAPVALGPTDATPKSSRSVSRKSFLEEFHFDAHPHPPPPSPRQRRRYRGRSRHARRHDREWRDGRFFGRCRRSRSRTINSSAIQSTTGRSAAVHPTPRRPGRVQGQEPSVPRNRDHRREARPDAANLAGLAGAPEQDAASILRSRHDGIAVWSLIKILSAPGRPRHRAIGDDRQARE